MTLTELRKLADARTKGEWRHSQNEDGGHWVDSNAGRWGNICETLADDATDATFIAATGNHIDALLDVVEAAREFHDRKTYPGECSGCPLSMALAKLEAIK